MKFCLFRNPRAVYFTHWSLALSDSHRVGNPMLSVASVPQILSLLLCIHARGIPQPLTFRFPQTLIPLRLEYLVFSATHSIDRFSQMLGNVKFVEHDLLFRFWQMFSHRGHRGIPHIQGTSLDARSLLRTARRPESIQTALLAMFAHTQQSISRQIVHQRQYPRTLRKAFSSTPSCGISSAWRRYQPVVEVAARGGVKR